MSNTTKTADRLAVCSWSLQPQTPDELVDRLVATGIRRVQLALDPLRDNVPVWGRTSELFARAGIRIVSGMFGTVGEDYSTLESIRRTGGVVPDATWDQNWKNIQATVELASQLNLSLVTFHAGFLPHEPTDPDFRKLHDRIARIAELFAQRGMALGFETGQETAETLAQFLKLLNRPNVGVNFDPANMILYDKGDPIAALRVLAPFLRQCHLKDALRTRVPGTWGEEVPVGRGQVDWRAFFQVLNEIRYAGDLVVEREAGASRVEDIRAGVEFVSTLNR